MGSKASRDERRARAEAARTAQRERDRRHSRLVYGVAGLVTALVLAAPIANAWWQDRQQEQRQSVGYVTDPTSAAEDAGCTGVRNDRELGRDAVAPGAPVDYARLTREADQDLPPSSGDYDPEPLPDTPVFHPRDTAPRPERAVHNLANGYVVIWYDSELPADQVDQLRAVTEAVGSRVLAVPWMGEPFPDGRHVVLTAWDRTQRCRTVSDEVVFTFTGTYTDARDGADWESPTAPRPGSPGGTAP